MGPHARSIQKWWSPHTAFFLILLFGLFAAGRTKLFRDPGTFWHTIVGEQILQTHDLVHTDRFSFTCEGKLWIAQQWLGECVMALFHRASRLDGLLLAAAAVLAWTYAGIAERFLRTGLAWPATALMLMLTLAAGSYHFHPRPHLATLALMAWTFGLLCDIAARRVPPRRLYLLPPIFVIWTNIHGGVLGGIVTALFVMGLWFLRPKPFSAEEAPADSGAPNHPDRTVSRLGLRGRLCLVGVLLIAATLVNPYGRELPKVWLGLMDSKVLPTLIMEHGPLRWLSVEGVTIGAIALVYLLLLLSTLRMGSRRGTAIRVTWFVPLLWLAMAVMRVRHGPLFSITAAIAIADMLPHSPLPGWFARRGSDLFHSSSIPARRGLRSCVIPAVFVLAILLVQAFGVRHATIHTRWARLDENYWPVAATAALEDLDMEANVEPRMFNDMLFGGYLIYRLPGARVFIDDRCELYGDAFLSRYDEARRDPATFEAIVREYRIDTAMIRSNTSLDAYLANHTEWVQVHRDRAAALYCRRGTTMGAAL